MRPCICELKECVPEASPRETRFPGRVRLPIFLDVPHGLVLPFKALKKEPVKVEEKVAVRFPGECLSSRLVGSLNPAKCRTP